MLKQITGPIENTEQYIVPLTLSSIDTTCKADTSLRWTWLAGSDQIKFLFIFFCNKTLYKADTSLKRTVIAGPEGVRLKESSLYI